MTGIVNNIIGFWARNAVAANLLMCLAFAGSVVGLGKLEVETFPGGFGDGVRVEVSWPGASPREFEEQILLRLEEAVADLDGLRRVRAQAEEGYGWLALEPFSSIDIEQFLVEVRSRIDAVRNLPVDAYRPLTKRSRPLGQYFGVALHGDIDLRELRRMAETLRDEMAQLPGGELAELTGVLNEEVSIELSEWAMRRYGLDFRTVADAVRASSLNASGGSVRAETGAVSLQARSMADSRQQFESIIVRQTASGGVVTVGDVARVRDRFEDRSLEARYQKHPAAFIAFPTPEKMDLIAFASSLERYVEEKSRTLPEGVELSVMWSDANFFIELMRIISTSAFFGVILVCLLLMLFLRPIVAFWVAVGIATAFAGGAALAPYFGLSISAMSLFGALLVIGVVVDDAIVIGENIHSQIERQGRAGVDIVVSAATRVSRPVIFGVVTTMIAFAPWAFVSGPERQFTIHLTMTVIAALTFSLIEAFCILPNHLSHMRPQRPKGRGAAIMRIQARIADSLLWFADNCYRRVIGFTLKFRYATVAMFGSLSLFAYGLVAHSHVNVTFLPEIEGNSIQARFVLPDGTPFQRILEVRDRLEASVDALIAEFALRYPQLDEPVIQGRSVVASEPVVEGRITLMDQERRPPTLSSKELTERLRQIMGPVEDAEETTFDFTFDKRSTKLMFSLNHPELEPLKAAVDELGRHLSRYPSVFGVGNSIAAPADAARFTLKPGAEALGLTLRDTVAQIRQAYFGEEAQRLPRGGDDVRVMVRLPENERRSLDSLRDLRIRTPDGRQIPLPEVVDIEFTPGILRVERRDRRRSATIFAEAPDRTRGLIAKEIADRYLPGLLARYPGLGIEEIGELQNQREFIQEIALLQGAAFLIMYVLLAIAFSSYAQPLLIMTAIPFGFAGAVLAHWLIGLPMAMFSIFGISAAAGVVVNDNLVLVDQINFLRRRSGMGAIEALVEAGVSRFRPVFLTTLTTVIGLAPILADASVQGRFLKPMVLSMAGAVTFALFVTLLLVPALYAVGTEIRRSLAWLALGRPFRSLSKDYQGWKKANRKLALEDISVG